jgi:hypothetical protein
MHYKEISENKIAELQEQLRMQAQTKQPEEDINGQLFTLKFELASKEDTIAKLTTKQQDFIDQINLLEN